MKPFVLFTLIFGILAGAAFGEDSLYATADAAKYAEAARLVLIRGLTESIAAMPELLTNVDTMYVAYPDRDDPPQQFFKNLPFEKIVFAPRSKSPRGNNYNHAGIHVRRIDPSDSVLIFMGWDFHPRYHAGVPPKETVMTPSGKAILAKLVLKDRAWVIVDWQYELLK